ncbi:N-acetyltransferase [Phaeovulum sp. W22_SRMD_FR3]|uniref:N-acetyltransferase n=1 Tax=Phaeovulum sp. W22_SRMD_FR3 TaxID=3240274 RepID=UPI003F96522E
MGDATSDIRSDDARRLAAFDVSLRALAGTDADQRALHELAVGVGWPHRRRDIALLTDLGQGYLAVDDIERPLSSGMLFPVTPDLATIGMMITAPRLQAIGAGRWMLRRLMADSGAKAFLLNSTRRGHRLYESEGFRTIRTVQQHQGIARPIYLPEASALFDSRDMTNDDHAGVRALDAQAFGAARTALLNHLLPDCTGRVILEGDRITGYALIRSFGRGRLIGPVIAGSAEAAMALIAPMIAAHPGAFLRLDTPEENGPLSSFLSACGLGLFDWVIEMHRGPVPARAGIGSGATAIYGLAAQPLG